MTTKLGTELSAKAQRDALARFTHRFTRENKPAWTIGADYKVQFASDAEWLAHTRFEVRRDGELSNRYHYCQSNPTWPDNPELRKS